MSRYRAPSPGSRRLADPMRASTGAVFSSPFDPYYPPPRNSVSDFAPSRRVGPLEAQPISTRTYKDQSGAGTKSRTEYAIKPRRNTLDQEGAPPPRRPLSVVVPPTSPNRPRPVVTSATDRPRSPLGKTGFSRDDTDRYILPASNPHRHHKRIFSADAEDVNRLTPRDRDPRDRKERGGYRSSLAGGRRGYPHNGPLVRTNDYDDYSYTNPREQFDRDLAARPRPRADSYTRRERPISMANLEEFLPPAQSRREGGPPVSNRGFDKMLRPADDLSSSGRSRADSEVSRTSDLPRRRPSKREPVSVHHDRDGGYTSYRDDYDDSRDPRYRQERYDDERRAPSDRHSESKDDRRRTKAYHDDKERSGLNGGVAAAGIASGLAAAGLAATGLSRDSRGKNYEPEDLARREKKERRRREIDRDLEDLPSERDRRGEKPRDRDFDPREEPVPRERRGDRTGKDRADSGTDDAHSDRERHRRRHKDRRGRDDEPESSSDPRAPPSGREDVKKDSRDKDYDDDDSEGRRAERHRRRRERVLSDSETYAETPGETEDERPRRVQLVEPPKDKEPKEKPKGILKPPREKFPEDPNAVREGVAPLKDAGKKGVPPGARWTKISRNLVNPAALEEAHERFEERSDYVIVLRVLTREEIQKFAVKTQEIRDAREREYRREMERREREDDEYDYSDTTSDDDDDREPLRLEAPPPETKQQLPFQAPQQQQQQPPFQQPQPVYAQPPPQQPPPPQQQQPQPPVVSFEQKTGADPIALAEGRAQ